MIVFGETNRQQGKLLVEREWKLCDVTIHESITGKNVGIILQSDLKSIERTLNVCRKLRSIFMSSTIYASYFGKEVTYCHMFTKSTIWL